MSWNRTKYEECAYNLQMQRSTQPGDYRLYANYAENCNQCFSDNGPVGSKSDVSIAKDSMDLSFTNLADVESQLSWRGHKLNNCNDPIDKLDEKKLRHKPTCTSKLVSEDTRFTNPLDNYRGLSLTSYMVNPHLPINPQCVLQPVDDKVGLNSRLFVKDNFKPTPTALMMVDKGSALPVANPEQQPGYSIVN
jgi:hypothetical protein